MRDEIYERPLLKSMQSQLKSGLYNYKLAFTLLNACMYLC